MIIERQWSKRKRFRDYFYRGIFLFGIIPIYIKVTSKSILMY